MINIEQSYDHSQFLNQGSTTINRFVKDINFSYNSNGSQITAIKVWSQTGSSNQYPYVQGSDPSRQQILGVVIEGNSIYAMDTGIELDDCGECTLRENQINAVRVGIVDGGNNYALFAVTNTIQQASKSFTPNSSSSMGIYSYGQARWTCIGGTGQACTGGTITNSLSNGAVFVSPQGFNISGSTVEGGWDYGGYIINALGFGIYGGSCVCDSTVSLYVGNIAGLSLVDSTFSTSSATGPAIDIAAPTSTPAVGEAVDNGWWIVNSTISTDNNSTGTATGIKLESGVFPLVDLTLTGNQLFGFATAIQLNGPLTQSRIVGNYGDKNATSFITLNASGASSFSQTVIHDNTSRDSVPVLTETAGGGYILGYNSSASQVIGTFTATGPGCSIGGGSIGTVCGPITVSIPVTFADTTYSILGCSIVGASGEAAPTLVGGSRNKSYFSAYEVSQTITAVSGGSINCQVQHQ